MRYEIQYELEISRYTGPHEPDPAADLVKVTVSPLNVPARMILIGGSGTDTDFSCLKYIVQKDDSPEFVGHNASKASYEDRQLQP